MKLIIHQSYSSSEEKRKRIQAVQAALAMGWEVCASLNDFCINEGDVDGWKKFEELEGVVLKKLSEIKNGYYSAESTSLLLYAAWEGKLNLVKWLLANGASVHERSKSGYSALHFAAEFGYLDIVEYLLANRARTDVRDFNHYTPLGHAAQSGNNDITKCLIAHGDPVDEITYSYGFTALMWAASYGDLDMVKWLVGKGARLDIKDIRGDTALLHAAGRGAGYLSSMKNDMSSNLETVKWLLANGANIEDKSNAGTTIFDEKGMQQYQSEFSELRAIAKRAETARLEKARLEAEKAAQALAEKEPAKEKPAQLAKSPDDALDFDKGQISFDWSSNPIESFLSYLPSTLFGKTPSKKTSAESDLTAKPITWVADIEDDIPEKSSHEVKTADAQAVTIKTNQKTFDLIKQFCQRIQTHADLSPEKITELSSQLETLKDKVGNLETTQLTPQNRELLTQLAKDEIWLTLLRFGQSLQQQDKTLAFFQQHPVLWETYLTLITILSNQFLSAKLLHTKILDVKAKTWFKEQGIVSNTSDMIASHVAEVADLAHIPLLSGVAKGLVKIYESQSQKVTRELFNPLIEYAPTLSDQDKLIQQIAFLTIARFHELLLLAEKVDSKDLLNSFANTLSEKLKLGELKQKFNDLLKRDEHAGKKITAASALGTLFGEFLADKLMEIILSEYEVSAYQKAKQTRDFVDLILAWLRSDVWDTLPVSVAGKKHDLEATFFSKLLHVNDAKIIWDGKEPISIVHAIRQSGFKHYQPATQWAYKAGHADHPETVGYLYEMDPDEFVSALLQTSSQHAAFSTRESKTLITDAESHYASMPVLASTAASGAAPVLFSQSSSSRVSPVGDSVSTHEVDLEQRMMQMIAVQFAQSEEKHRAELAEQKARIAAIEAENQRLQTELANRADKSKIAALEQRTERAEDKLGQLHPAAFAPKGDGQMITVQDVANATPTFLAFSANVKLIAATADAALEASEKQAGRLDRVEGQVESVGTRVRRNERSGISFSSWGTLFASTSAAAAASSAPVEETQSRGNNVVDLITKLPAFMMPLFITRELANQRTLDAMRRAQQETAAFEAETEVLPVLPQAAPR